MRIIKLWIALIVISFVFIITSISVRADNITSVLRKYNVGIEQTDTETLEKELTRAASEHRRVEAEYREKQAMIHTVELSAQIMKSNIQANDTNAATIEVQRKETYLRALVKVDAGFDKIFEAERELREAQAQLGKVLDMSGILTSRIDSLDVYDEYLPDTSLSDVEQAETVLRNAKKRLADATSLTDIGVSNNIEFPVNYPVTVTSGFGSRNNPFGGAGTEFHYGLDLSAPEGSEVISLFNGVITTAEYNDGLGNYIIVTHGKELQTLYAHLSEIKAQVGNIVKQNDIIGLVGSTGRSTGPHLHLGVYINGQKVDPMVLFARG